MAHLQCRTERPGTLCSCGRRRRREPRRARDVLRDDRCRVLQARDGEQALAIMSQEQPDLVLLDLGMPHAIDWNTFDELHRTGRLKELCIVLITASLARAPPDAVAICKPFGLPVSGAQITRRPFVPLSLSVTSTQADGRARQP